MSDSNSQPLHEQTPDLPRATVRPRRRWSLAWLLPVLALAFVAFLLWRSWSVQGPRIEITFAEGYGLRVGDEIRYRGIVVGEVEALSLSAELDSTIVTAQLLPDAAKLARTGSQFWIVRPHVGPSGVKGLDTVIGPRYVAVSPGKTDQQRTKFIGLNEPPVVADIQPDDLEIVLRASDRGSLQPGGPVMYRGVRVGTILAVGLASDSSAVEARAHIERAYTSLITEETRFWDGGGAKLGVEITGITLDVDSLSELMVGSIELAVPPNAGRPVRTGHRFNLRSEPDDDWLEWQPGVAIGSELLPGGVSMPQLEKAQLTYETKYLRRDKSNAAWVLQLSSGLLGPVDVLTQPDGAKDGSVRLEIAGKAVTLDDGFVWQSHGMGLLINRVIPDGWQTEAMRSVVEPEDCLLAVGSSSSPIAVSAAMLKKREGMWKIDEAMSFSGQWHGAAVIARSDGALLGILLVEDGGVGRVALWPND